MRKAIDMYPNVIKYSIYLRNEYAQSIESTYDEKRLAVMDSYIDRNIESFMNGGAVDSGLYGKLFELSTHDSNSTICVIRKQHWNDGYVLVNGKRKQVEVKTNGGRLGDYYGMSKRTRKARYLIYNLCFQPPTRTNSKGETIVPPMRYTTVFTNVDTFLSILESVKGAIKTVRHANYEFIGKQDDTEPAIQVSSKRLYETLIKSDIIFDRNKDYAIAEIL